MTTKHTPGPWEAQPPRLGAAITIYAGDTPIATTASNTSPLTMEMHRRGEIKANARLIAAAPELLEALESCVIWNGKRGPDDDLLPIDRQPGEIAKAMRAIAKAKGEQQ
ncbi:hypothetical protein ACOTI2_08230 [Achromobacter xylosoxidans]